MNDERAAATANAIRLEFWDDFERALEPKRASKRCYLEQLEELIADAQGRADCVRSELDQEE